MSEDKLDRLRRVTGLFDQFADHLDSVRENVSNQSKFSQGYMTCLEDILKGLKEDSDSELITIIKSKVDMDSRSELLDEVSDGLRKLREAYAKILSEE